MPIELLAFNSIFLLFKTLSKINLFVPLPVILILLLTVKAPVRVPPLNLK
jgi:hypothetical protein